MQVTSGPAKPHTLAHAVRALPWSILEFVTGAMPSQHACPVYPSYTIAPAQIGPDQLGGTHGIQS